jgi:addiction module RelE/StbE family toxin
MAKVFFTPLARQDLTEAGDYIAHRLHNRPAARNLIRKIQAAAKTLEQFPYSGTPLDASDVQVLYRYLVCGNYMVFYHISGESVWIDRILYGRRDYLAILFGNALTDENE